jgi:hypothetical protein
VTRSTPADRHSARPRFRALLLALLAIVPIAGRSLDVEVLQSVGGLPAHVAGGFDDLASCQQTPAGEYFVFDRRAHAVFSVAPPENEPRKLVQIGAEPGRVLRPYAFDLGSDGTFIIADAPDNHGRIQVFTTSGASLGGFTLATRDIPMIILDDLLVSGISSIEYTGRSILLNQPESGALVTEYSLDSRLARTFGELRATGHEQDREVHLAMNTGIVTVNPRGGYYFVFVAGTPLFRKYDKAGKLEFERHIEGIELDDYVRAMPNSWPRRRIRDGEVPIVQPVVKTAATDLDGNLWISLAVPYTYVYDQTGDKRRTIQFRATGLLTPRTLFFTWDRRVLVTPGCYAFPAGK